MNSLPPRSTLFPYTTLFRSSNTQGGFVSAREANPAQAGCCDQRHGHRDCVLRVVPHAARHRPRRGGRGDQDRKSTRLNSSHANISYAVFCLKKKKKKKIKQRKKKNKKKNINEKKKRQTHNKN